MGSVNRVFLLGNLGSDPELKRLPSGSSMTKLHLATNETFKNGSGEVETRTTWHNLVAWGKTADLAAQYLKKGSQVCVEGRLSTRTWEDKEKGEKRYYTDVVTDRITFLGKPAAGRDEALSEPSPRSESASGGRGRRGSRGADDLPF